jgi:Aspartyl protease
MPLNPSSLSRQRALRRYKHAFLEVFLFGPSGLQSTLIAALLDTGAAFTMVRESVARQVGYVTSQLPTIQIRLANGVQTTLPVIRNAPLEIEGHAVRVPRILLGNDNTVPLLSPGNMLLASEFGFDATAIYFD